MPEPEPPITTMEVLGMMSRSMPSSTTLSPKRLRRLRRRILGVVSVMRRLMPRGRGGVKLRVVAAGKDEEGRGGTARRPLGYP